MSPLLPSHSLCLRRRQASCCCSCRLRPLRSPLRLRLHLPLPLPVQPLLLALGHLLVDIESGEWNWGRTRPVHSRHQLTAKASLSTHPARTSPPIYCHLFPPLPTVSHSPTAHWHSRPNPPRSRPAIGQLTGRSAADLFVQRPSPSNCQPHRLLLPLLLLDPPG